MSTTMRFSKQQVDQFAKWSGDRNPLHVDATYARSTHFGQPLVHGMLSVVRALRDAGGVSLEGVRTLEIEFRGAVLTDVDYSILAETNSTGTGIVLAAGGSPQLAVQLSAGAAPSQSDMPWIAEARARGHVAERRPAPAALEPEDLRSGSEFAGFYETDPVPDDYEAVPAIQTRVLALCSYIIGMEVPGLRSLFTRASITWADVRACKEQLLYRATVTRFDRQFRILDLRVDIATTEGNLVAVAELRSYVRFSPTAVEPSRLERQVAHHGELAGKVALICGGTRGLGAELTAALAVSGCHVYATYHRDRGAANELARTLTEAGACAEMIEGDAGDAGWCEATRQRIESTHGGLDFLILNACAAPVATRLDAATVAGVGDYISRNLALVQVPTAAFLPALRNNRGTIVAISSSFVAEPPPGFAHYVALKQAVEATVLAAARETPGLSALIARPPRLQTTWNDTPTGVLGTIAASTAAVHIVNGLATAGSAVASPILSEFPALPTESHAASSAEPEFTIGLSATFTCEPLLPGLDLWFRELGVRGDVEVAPYGQVLQTLLSPNGGLSRRPGIHVVMIRVRDWLRELEPDQSASLEFLGGHLATMVEDLDRAVRAHRAQAAAETLLVLCPSEGAQPTREDELLAGAELQIEARLAVVPGVTVVRARAWHDLYGVVEADIPDPVREHIAHIPFKTPYFHVLATVVMRHVHRRLTAARKVIVVDCDNTLWGGVVGEAGAEGVQFDSSHAELHARLAALADSGVLIGLCSKNEEGDVWRVFDTRRELGLRRDQVVAAMVNWLPKSQNLQAMAARLNLGLDSFVFIDDNPVECAEVRAACPEVLTLEWPQDDERARHLLRHTWELDPRGATAEDQRRTELYKEEFRRQELQATALTFRDFIASLDLAVDIAPLAEADLQRASQLTLRTNQFNFTTKRRTESELRALAASGTVEIRTVRVRDRFGDYGLVGLLIAEVGSDELFADTLLLSCRVLGRGVEHHLVNELGRIAAQHGRPSVRLRVEPTRRNTPARVFLDSIAPAATKTTEGVAEAILAADWAASLQFEPPEQPAAPIVEDDRALRAGAALDGAMLRSREGQIARTASQLSSMERLAEAIGGAPAAAAPAVSSGEAAAFVEEAFARALQMDPARVREIDSLEALGCDSFRIVEITVGLLERFPWLPATLLFEHRSITDIVARIATLSRPGDDASTGPAIIARSAVGTPGSEADIAVVGMHLRCAGASSPAELWTLLSEARVSVTRVPDDRPEFFGRLSDDRPHFAGLLHEIDGFEPELFGITPREAELMDPQLRLFLEVALGALEDAGALGAGFDADTGVFSGVMYSDYAHRANLVARRSDTPFKSWEAFSLANRLSQIFGFRGPSLAIDTACSSSGTAVHLACRALKAGDCSVAVVGGVNLILDPDRFVQLGRLGILSPSGRCLAFGAEADGTVLGEGAGVVVLRPLSAALRRGDRIYGVIKATGVSTGSGTVGFTAPNPQAQAEAIRRAVHSALVDPRTISYVETHGTATALGDPIEVRGLTLAYGDRRLWDETLGIQHRCSIGSIKPNIGHLEAGAGVLSLIKVLLQLHHRTLLPSVTSPAANPQIPFDQTPFSIQRECAPWPQAEATVDGAPRTVPRRAALNSFGVGGANVHVLVEEAPAPEVLEAATTERPAHLLVLSARTRESLDRRLRETAQLVSAGEAALADICFSASTGARHLEHRAAATAASAEAMARSLEALADGDEPSGAVRGTLPRGASVPRIAFLFTGQGSQYAGMGRELHDGHPVFRQAMDACFDAFDRTLDRSLRSIMFAEAGTAESALLNQTADTQPALFTLGYALSRLWTAWGVKPDAVLGHSVGEITAMCVAGGLSLEEAAGLIAARGRLMQALPEGGAMTSVMTAEDRVLEAIAGYEDRVAVAAINAPSQVVISGDGIAVASITARLGAEGVRTKELVVSHAFHSPLMRPMLAEYEGVARRLSFSQPHTAFVSCVLGRAAGPEIMTAGYWVRNVIDPVRFTDGIRAVDELGITTFVEIGPQPILSGMGRQTLGDEERRAWLPSLKKDAGGLAAILESLGRLYTAGTEIDWIGFDRPWTRTRVSLPAYPYARRRYWIDASALPSATAPEAATRPAAAGSTAQVYEVAWRAAEPPVRRPGAFSGKRLLLIGEADDRRIPALTLALQAAGARVATGRFSDIASGEDLDAVVYVASRGSAGDPADAAIELAESAVVVMKSAARRVRLHVVTTGAVPVPDGGPMDLAQAPLWAAARTFALEHPEQWGGLIDAGGDPHAAAKAVVEELLSDGRDDQVARRGGLRYVPRLAAAARPESSGTIRRDRTYLVTGGLGALGLRIASWLAQRGATQLVLASRRGLTPETESAVSDIERTGARVTLVKGDTASRDDVAAMLGAVDAAAPLGGIFHAAGVDELRAIEALGAGDMARVMSGKVRGAWLLHEATRSAALEFFVTFSSIAAVLGSAQRAAYASGNAFLDALCHQRRAEGLPALSVNWGPWSGGGMATEPMLEQYARSGNHGISPEEGLTILDGLLAGASPQAMVANIEWTTFRGVYEARRERPLLSELAAPAPAAPAASDRAPWVEKLSGAAEPDRLVVLTSLLRDEVAATLGLAAADVAVDMPFRDMGMDSLMSADFAQRLRKRIGIRVTSMVFDHPTVRSLAPHLLDSVSPQLVATPPAPAPAVQQIDTTGLVTPESEAEAIAFQKVAFDTRPPDQVGPRWRWMFVESARRLGIEPRVWLHRQDGAVVGHNGAIPVRLKIEAAEKDTAWLVDTMVLEAYRDQGVGAKLMLDAQDVLPFALSLGQTEQMREIQFRLGWQQVAPLQTAQFLVRPERVLQGKLPAPAALAAALGVRASNFVRDATQPDDGGTVQAVERFTTEHDRIWDAMSQDVVCAVRRDASYLNWKYVDQPAQEFVRLEVIDNGIPVGVVVLMLREPDDAYRYRRAYIVDLVAPLTNGRLVGRLVRAAVQEASGRGADMVVCLHVSELLTRALRATGFRLRAPERYLLVRPGPVEANLAQTLLDGAAWFVTHGDSDIDRPW